MTDYLLHNKLSALKSIYGSFFFRDKAPGTIKENLRTDFDMRPYQQEAFGRFQFYWDEFADRIQMEDRRIRVNEVDNFSAVNPDDINIIFTTIQGLHSRLKTPRENSITFEDF